MLKDLRLPVSKTNSATVACAIVRIIFKNVGDCVQGDRSRIKMNMFEKGVIGGMINEKVMLGINKYVENMNENDLNILLNDIERELAKRRR